MTPGLRAILVLACGLLLAASPGREARAGEPTEQLRQHIDQVLKVLQTPELKGEGKTRERRQAVRRVAEQIFSFEETAKRTLAQHWHPRTPAERQEFVRLFADLLEHAYISKIDQYHGEKIAFVGETVEGDQGTVRTRIVTPQGTEVPVDYKVHREAGRWRVYDVVIEGVSLVANYRTQFNKIIQTSSYKELVERLRSRSTS